MENSDSGVIAGNEAFYLRLLHYIYNDLFPAPNSIFGILFYSFVLILFKSLGMYFVEKYYEKTTPEEEDFKVANVEISEKILERRKQKAKEAIEYLKKAK